MPSINKFAHLFTKLDSPGRTSETIVPSDVTDLVTVTRAIYVGVGGDVRVIMAGGMTQTFKAAAAGSILPICVSRVYATGTTATNLVGLQ